jgi:hypothetical protein
VYRHCYYDMDSFESSYNSIKLNQFNSNKFSQSFSLNSIWLLWQRCYFSFYYTSNLKFLISTNWQPDIRVHIICMNCDQWKEFYFVALKGEMSSFLKFKYVSVSWICPSWSVSVSWKNQCTLSGDHVIQQPPPKDGNFHASLGNLGGIKISPLIWYEIQKLETNAVFDCYMSVHPAVAAAAAAVAPNISVPAIANSAAWWPKCRALKILLCKNQTILIASCILDHAYDLIQGIIIISKESQNKIRTHSNIIHTAYHLCAG